MATCSGDHRERLFIGEAGFKGVSSLLEKHKDTHPSLPQSIIATELDTFNRTADRCPRCDSIERDEMALAAQLANLFLNDEERVDYSQETLAHTSFCSDRCERIRHLQNRGVTVILGFDGTKIHESDHPAIAGKRIKRIHWNCPHDKSSFQAQTLPPIIQSFFASCASVQEGGDRVHVTLAQPPEKEGFYQGCVYNIRAASLSSGYRLLAKRPFGSDRYPGYTHEMTGVEAPADGAQRQREFVFVKKPYPWPQGRPNHIRKTSSYYGNSRTFYERATDDESSGYSCSSDSDDD